MYTYDTTRRTPASTKKDELLKAQSKKQFVDTAAIYATPHLSELGVERMRQCGDWLQLLENDAGDQRKLELGFFCHSRWCPACAWRYSAAWGRILMTIDRYLCHEKGLRPIFVTLTVRNVPAEQLRDTLNHMAESWKYLMQRKAYKAWRNYARKTEVTYNGETYHPHYHVLIWVTPGYFGKSGGYISHDKLLDDWRAATGMPEITQVDIRRCKSASQEGAAVAEVAKYTAKASDYLLSQDVFDGFYNGLHGIRVMSLAGEAKKAVTAFRRGKLDKFDPEQPDELAIYTWRVIYQWSDFGYREKVRTPINLTEETEARRLHRAMRQQDIAAIAQGFQEMTGRIYTPGGGVRYQPVLSPWDGDFDG